jgi:hypothetical protein
MKRILAVQFLFLSSVLIILSGCTAKVKQQAALEPTPREVAVPASAESAVNAVGGQKAWRDTEVILGRCAVKFYRPDGTYYLTSQRHAVYPWSEAIRIYDAEPQDTFVWQLSGDSFKLLSGSADKAAKLPLTLCDPYIARALWNIIAAPASVAANARADAAVGRPLRIEGLWHYPFELTDGRTLYMNRDSNIFDIYSLGKTGQAAMMARGYDYITVEKTGITVPSKIEIFQTECACTPTRKIAQFDYQTLESLAF